MQEMNRRSFVKGAGAGIAASAVVASPALACDCPDKTDGIIPTEWDYETEVLIVGFGAAGVNAALASCMAGAKLWLLRPLLKSILAAILLSPEAVSFSRTITTSTSTTSILALMG